MEMCGKGLIMSPGIIELSHFELLQELSSLHHRNVVGLLDCVVGPVFCVRLSSACGSCSGGS